MDLLGSHCMNALKSCAEAQTISKNLFNILVKFSLDSILQPDLAVYPEALSNLDVALAKQSHAALISLILEAAKVDIQGDQLTMILDECNFSTDMKETFISNFNDHRSELRDHLNSIGFHFPHVQNLDWRLDYNIKNNHLHKVDALQYTLSLKVTNDELIEFTCSREELQDLSAKLKEAVKAVERAMHV